MNRLRGHDSACSKPLFGRKLFLDLVWRVARLLCWCGAFQPRQSRAENNAQGTPTRSPPTPPHGKSTETTPSAEALPPPRQRNRHARRLMPPGVVEVEARSARLVCWSRSRQSRGGTPHHPGRKSTAGFAAVVEIRSPNWRTYDVWWHLGRR